MLVQIFERFVGMLVLTSEWLLHIYSNMWKCCGHVDSNMRIFCAQAWEISCGRAGSKMRTFCGHVDSNMQL